MKFGNLNLNQVHKLLRLVGVKVSKKTLGLIVILIVGIVIWLQARSGDTLLRADYYDVTQVFDGDTIEVDMAGNLESVRMIGIDTPETHHPDVGVQCYGQEASDRTKQLLEGHRVRLVADELGTNRDRYDRLLRYVYDEQGTLINGLLVREGYAFATTAFRYGLSDLFSSYETAAHAQKIGIWAWCRVSYDSGHAQTQVLDESDKP